MRTRPLFSSSIVSDNPAMGISCEASTYDFLLGLSRRLQEGESLPQALSHAHKGSEAVPTAEQSKRLEEHIRRLRLVNQEALIRYHQDNGV